VVERERVPAAQRVPLRQHDVEHFLLLRGGCARSVPRIDLRPGAVLLRPVVHIDADLIDILITGIAALGALGRQMAAPRAGFQQNRKAAPGSPRSTVTTWLYPAM